MCLLQGFCAKVSSINDKSDWKTVRKALSVIELNEGDTEVRLCCKSYNKLKLRKINLCIVTFVGE